MTSEIRTFRIRDDAVQDDEAILAEFLRTVEVSGIETAFADGAWRILVLYQDLRRREETRQIHSAIVAALNQWRRRMAAAAGGRHEDVIPDAAVSEIARYAPTTEIELGVVAGSLGIDVAGHGAAIVQVVRQTLEGLTDAP